MPAELTWGSGAEVVSLGGRPPANEPDAEIVWGEREAFVLSRGRQLRVAFPDPLARDIDAASSGGAVLTPIHGRVVEVAVAPGQRVAKGDPLFTVEAMKMEHAVVAPLAGTVETVRITVGQQVEQGAPAIRIEPEGAEPAEPPVE
jgi:3-methylcrotonyl-CoA carboxylase alpha subunit